jgi:putative SOS response-associated peptidase YedK
MFKAAFAGQRLIVPMNGYVEWTETARGKQPHFIQNGGLLSAAGLYASRQENGQWKRSFTIITRAARDASGEVHDRMPVFLTSDTWGEWLSPEKLTVKEEMLALLDHSSLEVAASLSAYPVNRRLNNVRSIDPYDPSLIEPDTEEG